MLALTFPTVQSCVSCLLLSSRLKLYFPHTYPLDATTNDTFQARAHEINQVGLAEASAILAKGEAEAKVNTIVCVCRWIGRAQTTAALCLH